MLPKAAVVCVLLALFSAGSTGNKEANVYNRHLAAWKALGQVPQFPQFDGEPTVFRRDSETCSPFSDEYNRRLALLQCGEEYIQAVFSEIEASSCSNVYYNTVFFAECGTNHNGAVCGSIPFSKYKTFYNKCDTSDCTCSNGCQTELCQLSDSVGCCIHDNYDARMPSVWRNCNIQQPEVCADTPNTADIVAKCNIDPCTEECSLRQVYYVFCKYLGEGHEQINEECGFEDVVYYCGFDKGKFCVEMDYQNSYFKVLISDECYSNSEEGNVTDGVCSTNCKNVLVEFIDTVGCCFNSFNSTFPKFGSSTSPGLSSDLFSLCGIEVPHACNSFNSTAVPDDFLECAGRTINTKMNNTINTSGAALQSGVYSIGLIIIGLIGTYI